jgi:uncharacterized protein (TIGR03086 family)
VSEYADRYRRLADAFTQRVDAVPRSAWDNPAPCEGWVARDVVRHLVEWIPGFFEVCPELQFPSAPSVGDDPAGAWHAVDRTLRAALDDPTVSAIEFDMQMGRFRIDHAIDMFCTGDILVHTWDLARATGLDETLDPGEVRRMYEGMLPMDAALRDSGHFGPRVEVPESADDQTKLLAFTGRRP